MTRARGHGVRSERVSEQVRMLVAEILQRDLKDPGLGLVTCTRVSLTRDLRYAKLYVGVLGDEAERERTMEALARATSYVRRLLSSRLRLRVSPEVEFVFDPSVEYSIRLESILDETKKNRPADADELEDADHVAEDADGSE